MFKINKKIEYALMVLKHYTHSQQGQIFTAREICDFYHIPFDTTSKVMQLMNSKGILTSQQGIKGGYTLSSNLQTLSFLELAELIDGKDYSQNCEDISCSLINSCNITGSVKKLNQYLYNFLKQLTLNELLQDNGPNTNLLEYTKMSQI